jgi:uncharacterized membrane protein YvbJ
MNCSNCGSEVNEGVEFCPNCGARVGNSAGAQYTQQQYSQPQYSQPQYNQPQTPQYGYPNPAQDPNFDYTPISMWGYFGYEILFSIPCVGLVLLLVFSFGGTKNINLRNFARSYFCFLIVVVIIAAIFMGIVGASTARYLY